MAPTESSISLSVHGSAFDDTLLKGYKLVSSLDTEGRTGVAFRLFLLWTFVLVARPQDYLPFLAPLRPVLVITLLTFAATLAEGKGVNRQVYGLKEVRLILIFYAALVVGVPFAVHKGVAFNFVTKVFPTTLLYLGVFLTQVDTRRKLERVAWVLTISIFFSGLFYLKTAAGTLDSAARLAAGQVYDPNDIALLFTTYLPMCLYVLVVTNRSSARLLALSALIISIVAVMATKSRGGVLALGCIFFALLFFKNRYWRGFIKYSAVVLMVGVFLWFFSTVQGRFQGMEDDYNLTEEGGRFHIWKQDLEVLLGRPILGVGANCSAIALGLYRQELEEEFRAWQVPHSSLLQIAVETGLVGLVIYLSLNLGVIRNLRRIRRYSSSDIALFSYFLELSFYGFWPAALLLSHGYSTNLFILIGLGACVRRLNSDLVEEKTASLRPSH